MSLPFAGLAIPLSPGDIDTAAVRIGCMREAIEAVCIVETGDVSGFLSDGSKRPRILFEAKRFGDATGHRYDASHPLISTGVTNWKLYQGGAAEYTRLAEALALARVPALASTSWGLFQVMGSNAVDLGYGSVEAFVACMSASEGEQLEAFVRFVEKNHLAAALKTRNWAAFALAYNGPAYQVNRYDIRLAAAFAQAGGHMSAYCAPGSKGPDVAQIQTRLTQLGYACGATDGALGRVTELAVRRFQSARGIPVDGIVGPGTLTALFPGGVPAPALV